MSFNFSEKVSDAYKDDFVKISEAYDKYVVVPLNAFGLGGFVFDVEGSTVVSQESAITDNYVEDNSAIQDNIALRPKKIRLKRYVGELLYEEKTNPIFEKIRQGVKELTIISGLLPTFTDTVGQIKRVILAGKDVVLSDYIEIGENLWNLAENLNPFATKQQKAYLYLTALQTKKILVSVQTPFEFLSNMAIENIISEQDESTRFVSNFEITLKQIRTAKTETTKVKEKADRTGVQTEDFKDFGKVNGVVIPDPEGKWTDFGNFFSGVAQ